MKEIATFGKTNEILKKYQLSAKKNFGQNFIVDLNIINNIVSSAEITKDSCVIEIGPGIGALTERLAQKAKKVLCFEIDMRLKPILEECLASYDNIDIVFEDFLKIDLNEMVEMYFEGEQDIVVVANLPYYITTPILIKIFESQSKIKRICAMMQKEVGLRLSATKDCKDYNSLTILTNYYTDSKIVIKVPRNVFIPVPNVDSVVVLFNIIPNKFQVVNEEFFFKLLRVLFKQRRKTILNNLNELFNDKVKTNTLLNEAELSPQLRAENLSIEDIIRLEKIIIKEL